MKYIFRILIIVALPLSLTVQNAFSEEKVLICHKHGTPQQKEMRVPASAVTGHLRHGDHLGPCDGGDTGGGR